MKDGYCLVGTGSLDRRSRTSLVSAVCHGARRQPPFLRPLRAGMTNHYTRRRVIGIATPRRLIVAIVCVATLLATESLRKSAAAAPKSRSVEIGQMSGIDLRGRLHRFASTEDCTAVVFVFLSVHCPVSNGTLPELRRIAARHTKQDVEFYGVVSDPSVSRTAAIKHRKDYRVGFPVLFDASLELRRWLRPTHTPQAIVLSPSGTVVYSGRIDNRFASIGRKRDAASQHDLDDALSATVSGEPVRNAETVPVGCPLEAPSRPDATGDVTFNRDIAPLIFAHCSECHRPGEAAPFSLLTFDDVNAHAKQIVNVTKARFMPPWHPFPSFGHFRDARRLTAAEIALISRWVNAGQPEGDRDELPASPRFAPGWRLGRPDLVLRMPEFFAVASDGPDVHQHFVLPAHLRENRLVAAVEFRPGNARIVHHASFYIDTKGNGRRLDARDPDVGYGGGPGSGFPSTGSLRSWLPGMTPRRLPAGTGQLLSARSDVVVEIHYQRTGKPESDQSSIGIYFAGSKARQIVYEMQVMAKNLDIPADATRHRHRASYTLPANATLLDAAPHMHLLGKEMKATATLPDGQVRPLIWIKDWDFNWQGQYMFVDPVRLPAGTRIDVDAWYDNSAANGLNPHTPPRRVVWGDQTVDEMGICHFRYTCDTRDELDRVSTHHLQYCQDQHRSWERLESERNTASR